MIDPLQINTQTGRRDFIFIKHAICRYTKKHYLILSFYLALFLLSVIVSEVRFIKYKRPALFLYLDTLITLIDYCPFTTI